LRWNAPGTALPPTRPNPSGDELKKARTGMHQAYGALAIVGLDGITEFAERHRAAARRIGRRQRARCGGGQQGSPGGFAALRGYLDDLMAGHPDQPLKLFAPYRAMAVARGQLRTRTGIALFFPDLTQRPPKREREIPPLAPEPIAARLKAARLGFERGLLKWLKNDPKGAPK
jgi:chemosensory pili system protein ChpA (sensor histidine kinase/response regulator)